MPSCLTVTVSQPPNTVRCRQSSTLLLDVVLLCGIYILHEAVRKAYLAFSFLILNYKGSTVPVVLIYTLCFLGANKAHVQD